MCGIAGFSLSPNDRHVNAKLLSRALLLDIESRGGHATGFAFREPTGKFQIHKAPVKASEFVKRRLCIPKRTRTAIMHTRFATLGEPNFNENNHPIPSGNVVGVHNGCLENYQEIFDDLEDYLGFGVRDAEVDSEAIFAALGWMEDVERETVLETIVGSASIAWFDETDGTERLHLACIKSNPLYVCMTESGSVLFASTQTAIREACKVTGLVPKKIWDTPEGEYLTVLDGTIETVKHFTPHPDNNRRRYHTRSYVSHAGSSSWSDWDYENEYTGWWNRNLRQVEEQGARRNGGTTTSKTTTTESYGPMLDSDFITKELDIPFMSYDENRRAYKARLEAIDAWTDGLGKEVGTSEKGRVKYDLKAFLRVGDRVSTDLGGWRVHGQVYKMPREFPGGDYILRVFVPVCDGSDDPRYEPVFVARKGSQFTTRIGQHQQASNTTPGNSLVVVGTPQEEAK